MGFLKHLLFWPVTGPMYLTEFSLGKVQGVVKEHLTDDSRVKEALLDLQLDLELGEIDDEEYVREEARLMRELREVRRWREEFGMGTRGGVVQMGDAERPPEGTEPGADDDPATRESAGEGSGRVVGGGTRATLDISLDWEDEPQTADEPAPDEETSDAEDVSDRGKSKAAEDEDR